MTIYSILITYSHYQNLTCKQDSLFHLNHLFSLPESNYKQEQTYWSGKWLPPTRQDPHDLHVKPRIFAACCGCTRLETCITPYEHSGSNNMSLDNARLWYSCQKLSMNFTLCCEQCCQHGSVTSQVERPIQSLTLITVPADRDDQAAVCCNGRFQHQAPCCVAAATSWRAICADLWAAAQISPWPNHL